MITINEFAKLHRINKRTLHYYDEIGLFSPNIKKDNNYRYYTPEQSIEFEYIMMLKDLNMSLTEIKLYIANPSRTRFKEIIADKRLYIENQINKYQNIAKLLSIKDQQIKLVEDVSNYNIKLIEMEQAKFKFLPYDFDADDILTVFEYVNDNWGIENARAPIGSCISVENILDGKFESYHGLFSFDCDASDQSILFEKGSYLQLMVKGDWDNIPIAYNKLIEYAELNGYILDGYAYEVSLNDFVVSSKDEYVTQIMVKIK